MTTLKNINILRKNQYSLDKKTRKRPLLKVFQKNFSRKLLYLYSVISTALFTVSPPSPVKTCSGALLSFADGLIIHGVDQVLVLVGDYLPLDFHGRGDLVAIDGKFIRH